jgi:hypothetical protein
MEEPIILLDLKKFKTKKCPIASQPGHNPRKCPYYHPKQKPSDFRRDPAVHIAELCQYAPKKLNKCLLKDDCPYAHNASEELFHPDKYKTKFCASYNSGS